MTATASSKSQTKPKKGAKASKSAAGPLAYEQPSAQRIAGVKGDWELVIGMEVHAQVLSNAKLFSGASTAFGAEPNANVSLVDAAMPGMLPVINEH